VIVNGGPKRSQCPTPVIGDAQGFPRLPPRPSPGRSAATLSREAREGRGSFAVTRRQLISKIPGRIPGDRGSTDALDCRHPVSPRADYRLAQSPVSGANARDERQTPKIVWFLALLRVVDINAPNRISEDSWFGSVSLFLSACYLETHSITNYYIIAIYPCFIRVSSVAKILFLIPAVP
jgi:hypothetical protein